MALWLLAAVLLGLAAALIARAKGRPFLPWLAYGAVLGIVAVPHALCLPEENMEDHSMNRARGGRDGRMRIGRAHARAADWEQEARLSGGQRAARRDTPRPRGEVAPAWSDDAFAKLFSEGGREGSYAPLRDDPAPSAPRDSGPSDAPQERKPHPAETTEVPPSAPGNAAPEPVERIARNDEPERADARRAGRHQGPGGHVELRVEQAPYDPEDGHGTPHDRGVDTSMGVDRPRSYGRDYDRIEPRLTAGGSGGDQPPLSDEAWIASRFAPYGGRRDVGEWRDEREAGHRGKGWYYGLAAACVLIAAVFIGPGLTRFVSSMASSFLASGETPSVTIVRSRPDPLASRPATDTEADSVPSTSVTPVEPQTMPLPGMSGGPGASRAAPSYSGDSVAGTNLPGAPLAEAGSESEGSAMAKFSPPPPPPALPKRGPGTRSSEAAPAASAPRPSRGTSAALRPGEHAPADVRREVITATGQMVVLIQAELRKRGYDPGPVDGLAGQKTIDAVRAFRRDSGIEGDGGIDDDLLQKLGIVGRRLTPFKRP